MTPKILFLDLDGTLLNDKKEITPENRRAVREALDRGHRVVIASGRPSRSALCLAQELGLDGKGCFVISYQGAAIYDCTRREELFRHSMDPEDLYALFDEANRRETYIQTYAGEDVIVERRNDSRVMREYCRHFHLDIRVVEDIRQGLSRPPVKAMLIEMDRRDCLEDMARWVRSRFEGRLDCFFSSAIFLEAVPMGVSKGAAAVELCRILKIPLQDSVAVGDEENDVSMLRAAGIGAAMANAAPAAKTAADYITRNNNNHDGVAEVIRQFLL